MSDDAVAPMLSVLGRVPSGIFILTASHEGQETGIPILYIEQEILSNGIGAGTWDGAPSVRTTIGTMEDPVMFIYFGDGSVNPARGAAGGKGGVPSQVFLCKVKSGTTVEEQEEQRLTSLSQSLLLRSYPLPKTKFLILLVSLDQECFSDLQSKPSLIQRIQD